MAKRIENSEWLSSCPICSWKGEFATEKEANTQLNNHVNIKHREGKKTVKHEDLKLPPSDMPPQIPKAIKERK